MPEHFERQLSIPNTLDFLFRHSATNFWSVGVVASLPAEARPLLGFIQELHTEKFHGGNVAKLLRRYVAAKRVSAITFGFEGGIVVYLNVSNWHGEPRHSMSDGEWEDAIRMTMGEMRRELEPSDLTLWNPTRGEIRAWFD